MTKANKPPRCPQCMCVGYHKMDCSDPSRNSGWHQHERPRMYKEEKQDHLKLLRQIKAIIDDPNYLPDDQLEEIIKLIGTLQDD